MEEYSIRVNQLHNLKTKSVLKILLWLFVGVAIEFIFYYGYKLLRKLPIFDYVYNEVDAVVYNKTILYFIIINVILIIVLIIYGIHLNKIYKKQYLEYLFNECKLEEIYLLEHKINRNEETNNYLKKLFDLDYIYFKKSYSDASSKFSLDINTIKYLKKGRNHIGTLFSVNFDQEKPGYLQLCNTNYVPFNIYNGIPVGKYGFSFKSYLKNYHMYSTYGSKSYILESEKCGKCILNLEAFFNQRVYLIFDNDSLYLFVKDFKIFFVDNILKPVNNQIFDEKIEVIKKFHNVFFDLITMFDDVFITKF